MHEVKGYDALMELHDVNPDRLLGDKGYDSDEIRNDLMDRGIEPVIPPRSNRKTPIEYDREAYKRRNLVERCVNRLKQFRRIATRYEKTARAYLSMLSIAAARLWIKNCQHGLALQLRFVRTSELMGHHDLGDHGWLAHRLRRRWSFGRRCYGM